MRQIAIVIFLSCLLINAFSQVPMPNLHHLDINIDKPGSQYQFSFIHLTDTHIGEGEDDYGTEGFTDLPPKGDIGAPAIRLRRSVNWFKT